MGSPKRKVVHDIKGRLRHAWSERAKKSTQPQCQCFARGRVGGEPHSHFLKFLVVEIQELLRVEHLGDLVAKLAVRTDLFFDEKKRSTSQAPARIKTKKNRLIVLFGGRMNFRGTVTVESEVDKTTAWFQGVDQGEGAGHGVAGELPNLPQMVEHLEDGDGQMLGARRRDQVLAAGPRGGRSAMKC